MQQAIATHLQAQEVLASKRRCANGGDDRMEVVELLLESANRGALGWRRRHDVLGDVGHLVRIAGNVQNLVIVVGDLLHVGTPIVGHCRTILAREADGCHHARELPLHSVSRMLSWRVGRTNSDGVHGRPVGLNPRCRRAVNRLHGALGGTVVGCEREHDAVVGLLLDDRNQVLEVPLRNFFRLASRSPSATELEGAVECLSYLREEGLECSVFDQAC